MRKIFLKQLSIKIMALVAVFGFIFGFSDTVLETGWCRIGTNAEDTEIHLSPYNGGDPVFGLKVPNQTYFALASKKENPPVYEELKEMIYRIFQYPGTSTPVIKFGYWQNTRKLHYMTISFLTN